MHGGCLGRRLSAMYVGLVGILGVGPFGSLSIIGSGLTVSCATRTRDIEADAGPQTTAPFELTLTVSPSPMIPTVGIAHVGLGYVVDITSIDLRYGTDPKTLDQEVHLDPDAITAGQLRAALVGLKQDTMYHARVDVNIGAKTYRSELVEFTSGALFNGLPVITAVDTKPDELYGGFTVACTGAGAETAAFIFDQDGDYVWAFPLTETPVKNCARARLSYDAQHLWIGNVNIAGSMGALLRVPIDGLGEVRTYPLPDRHHDFTMLPNGHLAYIVQANGEAASGNLFDSLLELDPETGSSVELYSQASDLAALIGTESAHTNYITYIPELQALSFSMRQVSTIGLISYPQGQLLAKFGGVETSFEAMNWTVQHGHHLFADQLFVFSNHGPDGASLDSRVLGYSYDLATSKAELTFEYVSGEGSVTFGEVRQLPNHNLFITYSNAGIIHEVNARGELLRELKLAPIGYTEHRKSLYGAPPPFSSEPSD